MKEFNNKVAVITGAASGIGRGLAERCAQEKMKIVLADVETEALFRSESEIKEMGADLISVVTDVSKIDDVKNLAQMTLNTYGNVDLLFNNAGVGSGSSLWESTINDCKWVIDVNLWGVIHCIREFIPIMLEQNTACHVVNTASIAGLSTYHPSALYHLTKHAIVALSEQLYHDLFFRKANIHVSVLCPGFVNTNIMDSDRNRPEEYKNDPFEVSEIPGSEKMEEGFRQLIMNGMSTSDVADYVFQAIAAEKFFIFTHPDLKGLITSRMDDIVQERNPTIPLIDGL